MVYSIVSFKNLCRKIIFGLPVFFLLVSSTANSQALDSEISRLISEKKLTEAAILLHSTNPTLLDVAFFDARLQKAAKEYKAAIHGFREILRKDPKYLNARRELAHTLMLDEQYEAAEFNFKTLLRIDEVEEMRNGYLHFLRLIDGYRPIKIDGSIGILPSTNVNSGSENEFFVVGGNNIPNTQVESGYGIRANIIAEVRKPITNTDRLSASFNVDVNAFSESQLGFGVGTFKVGWERFTADASYAFKPYYKRYYYKDDREQKAPGIEATAAHRIDGSLWHRISLIAEDRDFGDRTFLNGYFAALTNTISFQPSSDVSVFTSLLLDRQRAEVASNAYDGFSLMIGGSKNWIGGLNTTSSIRAGKRYFQDDFPFLNNARQDTYYDFNFAVHHTRLTYLGLLPVARCAYRLNYSNVSIFDIKTLECGITLTSRF